MQSRLSSLLRLPALASALAIACCAPPPPPPTPSPPPIQRPAPTPTPAPPPVVQEPVYDNWLDAPRTPGRWVYRSEEFGTQAFFGEGTSNEFVLQCNVSPKQIAIARPSLASGERIMRIRTETTARVITARPTEFGRPQAIVAFLDVSDPLLDAMALTRGRFAVETEGMRTLYLPAWGEVSRVIEDCR